MTIDLTRPIQDWVFYAYVRKVVDGDTLKLDVDTGFRHYIIAENYRLDRINSPEIRGDEKVKGQAARDWLEEFIEKYDRVVLIKSRKHGKYRWLIEVWSGPNFTVNLNDELVKEGHAVYAKY